jgi:hypothetical protein
MREGDQELELMAAPRRVAELHERRDVVQR